MKTIRVFTIVAFFCIGIQTSHAQDVHVFLAADHVRTFTEPYLSPSGGTFGLRFPVERVAVELAFSHAKFGRPAPAHATDHRTMGTATVTYAFRVQENWRWEVGIGSGYGNRYVIREGISGPWIGQVFIPFAAVASIRSTRSEWVQPFLCIIPGYDHMIPILMTPYDESVYPIGAWSISFRAGVSIALPNDPKRGG